MKNIYRVALGLLLAAGGLFAELWERREGRPQRLAGNPLPGLSLYCGLVGGWFLLAWMQEGQALIDKMIGRELIGHALHDDKGEEFPGSRFYGHS